MTHDILGVPCGDVSVRAEDRHLASDPPEEIIDTLLHESIHAWEIKRSTDPSHGDHPRCFKRAVASSVSHLIGISPKVRDAVEFDRMLRALAALMERALR